MTRNTKRKNAKIKRGRSAAVLEINVILKRRRNAIDPSHAKEEDARDHAIMRKNVLETRIESERERIEIVRETEIRKEKEKRKEIAIEEEVVPQTEGEFLMTLNYINLQMHEVELSNESFQFCYLVGNLCKIKSSFLLIFKIAILSNL